MLVSNAKVHVFPLEAGERFLTLAKQKKKSSEVLPRLWFRSSHFCQLEMSHSLFTLIVVLTSSTLFSQQLSIHTIHSSVFFGWHFIHSFLHFQTHHLPQT